MSASEPDGEDGYDVRGSPKVGLTGATVGFFFGFAAVALFGPTASRFGEVMTLDPWLVGMLAATPMLFGSLLRIPFGAWCETTGGRKPFLVLMLLSVAGMIGLTTVLLMFYPDGLTGEWYPVIFLLGALSGCGIATFSVGISQTSYWFPRVSQGKALGIYAGLGNTAPGIFTIVIPFALAVYALTSAYLVWLGFLVLGTILYYYLGVDAWYFQLRRSGLTDSKAREVAKERGQEVFPEGTPTQTLVDSARNWKTWPLVALYFLAFGGYLALVAWYPTYWQEFFVVGELTAGILAGAFAIYGSLIRVAGGSLADRIGGEATAALALVTLLAGAAILTFTQMYVVAIVATFLVGTGMGVTNAAVFKKVPEEVPNAVSGASAWVGGLGAFGGFVIPPVLGGFVSQMGDVGYARGFFVYVVLAIVGLTLVYALSRSETQRRRRHKPPTARTNPRDE